MKILIQKLKNFEIKVKLNKKKDIKAQLELLENIDLFLQKGYSLSETINILYKKYKLQKMREDLRQGVLFSDILQSYEFDYDILLIIQIAEQSGNLKSGVHNSTILLKNKIESKDQLMEVLKYPLLLALLLILALGFVSIFLIPQFESIYASFGIELNILVKSIFLIINVLPILTIIIIFIAFLIYIYISTLDLKKRVSIYLKFDTIAKNYIKLFNQIFVINISNLLNMGMRLDEILEILSKQNYNLLIKEESLRIKNGLKQGMSFSECIDTELYHKELVLLIKEGEAQNSLLANLENYIIFAQKERENKTQKLLFLIQPVFYGIFGLLIVMLYISIFMPMYEMMESL